MTERDITGDAARSQYRKAMKIADRAELTDAELRTIADGVREFDAQRSAEQRTLGALEKIAEAVGPGRQDRDPYEFEQRRMRRRTVYALELIAVAMLSEDTLLEGELEAIRGSVDFTNLVARLKRGPHSSVPESVVPPA